MVEAYLRREEFGGRSPSLTLYIQPIPSSLPSTSLIRSEWLTSTTTPRPIPSSPLLEDSIRRCSSIWPQWLTNVKAKSQLPWTITGAWLSSRSRSGLGHRQVLRLWPTMVGVHCTPSFRLVSNPVSLPDSTVPTRTDGHSLPSYPGQCQWGSQSQPRPTWLWEDVSGVASGTFTVLPAPNGGKKHLDLRDSGAYLPRTVPLSPRGNNASELYTNTPDSVRL